MAHDHDVKLSPDSIHRHYNVIGVPEEDDVSLHFDLSDYEETGWEDESYNITIYDKDRNTLFSAGFTELEFTITIKDYEFGSRRAVAVIEDRTDIENIDAIKTIAWFVFTQTAGGPTGATVEGHVNVTDLDDSLVATPVYSTGIQVN